MHRLLTPFLLMTLATADASEVRLDGDIVQGGLVFGHAAEASRVELDGDALMLSEDGHFVFGFGRDDTEAVILTVEFESGQRWSRTLTPADRDFDIERIDGLDQNFVTPPAEVYERIREDVELTREARRRRDDRTDWLSGWIWPARGRISGVYGSQRILNGEPRNPHWGVDIAVATGTPVLAPAPGVVTLAEEDMYYSGGTLFLDHGHGLVSAFLHLDSLSVEIGDSIEQGQEIGRVGATGRATGPHLDWRINAGATRVDPLLLLDPDA